MESELRELLLALVDCIGRKTPQPVVKWSPSELEFIVQVDGRDQGRFIGKKGIVFWAINALFLYGGRRILKEQVRVNLLEPELRDHTVTIPFKPNQHWDRTRLTGLLARILSVCLNQNDVKEVRMEEPDQAEARFLIQLNRNIKSRYEDPNLSEAIETVIGAAAKSDGCKATVQIAWI